MTQATADLGGLGVRLKQSIKYGIVHWSVQEERFAAMDGELNLDIVSHLNEFDVASSC